MLRLESLKLLKSKSKGKLINSQPLKGPLKPQLKAKSCKMRLKPKSKSVRTKKRDFRMKQRRNPLKLELPMKNLRLNDWPLCNLNRRNLLPKQKLNDLPTSRRKD